MVTLFVELERLTFVLRKTRQFVTRKIWNGVKIVCFPGVDQRSNAQPHTIDPRFRITLRSLCSRRACLYNQINSP